MPSNTNSKNALTSLEHKNQRFSQCQSSSKDKNWHNLEKEFADVIKMIFGKELPKQIVVAVSGGSDSLAMLFLLHKIALNSNLKLIALTVDHKMRKESSKEALDLQKLLESHKINHVILQSDLSAKPTSNIEANLREMRYNLLGNFCLNRNIEHLFIAHHKQDIAENFLIRLFRGSGIDGLASLDYMTKYGEISLIRPLLDFNKEQLTSYLQDKKIDWFEDPTNQEEVYLRNKIRNFLQSFEECELINQRISSASKAILDSKKIICDDMIANKEEILEFSPLGYFLLFLENFRNLHNKESRQKAWRYLAWILMEVSGKHYKPRLKELQSLYEWIISGDNHKARSFYGCIIEKYDQEKLIIYREKSGIKSLPLFVENKENYEFLWDNRFLITLKGLSDTRIVADHLKIQEFNQLLKDNQSLKKWKSIKNPLKKVFTTILALKIKDKIIAVPQIDYYADDNLRNLINIKFCSKTDLTRN